MLECLAQGELLKLALDVGSRLVLAPPRPPLVLLLSPLLPSAPAVIACWTLPCWTHTQRIVARCTAACCLHYHHAVGEVASHPHAKGM